jgi:predicted enzyme related to lactoylglutathione lyase
MAETVAAQPEPRWNVAPYFIVDDVVATANYYRDKLGFRYARFWGEPPCFTIVQRSGAHIMLKQPEIKGAMHPNHLADPEDSSWDAYIWVDNAYALYEEFQRNGVRIVRPICDQPYGCRDFDIQDCNGYTLCLGQII